MRYRERWSRWIVGSRLTAFELARPKSAKGWAVAAKGGVRAITISAGVPPPTGLEMRFVTLAVASAGLVVVAARPVGAGESLKLRARPRKAWSLRRRLALLRSGRHERGAMWKLLCGIGACALSLARLLCCLSCPRQLSSHMIDCSRATTEAEECAVSHCAREFRNRANR